VQCSVATTIAVFLIGLPAHAQDETKQEPPKAESQPESPPSEPVMPGDEVPGMEPDDATSAPPAADQTPPKQVAPVEKSYLRWMIESSGPIGFVLFAMSFASVGLTVKFLMEMQRSKVIPPELVAQFENKIREKKYQEAYEIVRNNNSFLGKVLAAGLSKLSTGYAHAIEAMQEVGEDESMRLEHRLSWLAILGTTGPLLGLVGTVEGIIASFRVIATSETQPKPSLLAEGISTSLFNTFEGLLVAIIATIAFMLLKNQAARLVLEVGMISGNLMSRFSSLVRPGRSGTTAASVIEQTKLP
jgi:biopolymer transport protein ExbB